MKKLRFFVFLLYLALSGCSDGRKNSRNPIAETAVSTNGSPVIQNEDMTPGLKGIDADNNGIRDDIDRLIASKYSATSIIKKVAEQHARALQRSMEATNRDEAKTAGDEIFRAGDCAYNYLPHATEEDFKFQERMTTEIEALTANTKERLIAYWNGEALSGGMVFRQNSNPNCD